jgi:hypothetical protein
MIAPSKNSAVAPPPPPLSPKKLHPLAQGAATLRKSAIVQTSDLIGEFLVIPRPLLDIVGDFLHPFAVQMEAHRIREDGHQYSAEEKADKEADLEAKCCSTSGLILRGNVPRLEQTLDSFGRSRSWLKWISLYPISQIGSEWTIDVDDGRLLNPVAKVFFGILHWPDKSVPIRDTGFMNRLGCYVYSMRPGCVFTVHDEEALFDGDEEALIDGDAFDAHKIFGHGGCSVTTLVSQITGSVSFEIRVKNREDDDDYDSEETERLLPINTGKDYCFSLKDVFVIPEANRCHMYPFVSTNKSTRFVVSSPTGAVAPFD